MTNSEISAFSSAVLGRSRNYVWDSRCTWRELSTAKSRETVRGERSWYRPGSFRIKLTLQRL